MRAMGFSKTRRIAQTGAVIRVSAAGRRDPSANRAILQDTRISQMLVRAKLASPAFDLRVDCAAAGYLRGVALAIR